MQGEGEFLIPNQGGIVTWLRDTANSIEQGEVGTINRACFIGLDRGTNGFGYKPIITAAFLDSDEVICLLEVSKQILISEMFAGRDGDYDDSDEEENDENG